MIKRETLDQVRERTDIVELVGKYLPLKKVGKYWRGVCPFHPDKSPSFYVSPERQVYHCFGCGAGGSAINFVMQYDKVSFPEAVKALAEKIGIKVELEHLNVKHQPLYDACEFAATLFSQQLAKYSAAINYLVRRGMKDETVARFRLGYAPGGNVLRVQANKQGFSDEILLKAGLLAQRERGISDYFFARVVCPIMSLSGRVVGFSGRILGDGEPKYLNSPDTDIFHKSEILFGLFQAKNYMRNDIPILVEGNFDLLSLANRGINNVVAPLGTAFTYDVHGPDGTRTEGQALLLRRFNRQVRVLFDADAAGRKATRHALEVLLRAGLEPSVALLPDDYDPDDFITEFGKEKTLELIGQAIDPIDFMLRTRPSKGVSERNAVLRELLQLLSLIPDDMLRELYLNRLSEVFEVPKTVLRVRLPRPNENRGATAREVEKKPEMSTTERFLAIAAQGEEYTVIARYNVPVETFDDPLLRDLATRLYAAPEAGLVGLIDSLTDDATKRRVAAWEFLQTERPEPARFSWLARQLRLRWVNAARTRAESEGNADLAAKLLNECNDLKRNQLQKAR
jgi:DNA primase